MVLLGVILVLLAVLAGVVLFAGTAQLTDTVDIDVLGGTLSLPPLTLLVTGMVVISLFWLGWALMRGGLRRAKRRRVEAKEAALAAEARRVDDERRMQEEFAARERQLLDERRRNDEQTAALREQPGTRSTEPYDVAAEQRDHDDVATSSRGSVDPADVPRHGTEADRATDHRADTATDHRADSATDRRP
jgi:hypothetical protein